MFITVAKFGGSTINDAEKLDRACSTISSFVENGEKVVAVVSAVRGVTDTLKETVEKINEDNFQEYVSQCNERLKKLHRHSPLQSQDLSDLERQFYSFVRSDGKPWIKDAILVKGEELFSRNFADKLKDKGVGTELINFDSPEFPVIAHGYFGNAQADLEKTKAMCEKVIPHFKECNCICIPGYAGVDASSGRVKTLRRGGSDAVATALSYGFSANSLWIITDVNGIKRAYTEKITNAPTIPILCVEELRDAGIYGAKVPNEAAIRPLMMHCPREAFLAKYDDLGGEKTRIVRDKKIAGERPVELAAQREVIIYEFGGVNLHAKVSRLESELDEKLIDFISLGGGEYTRKLVIPSDQETYVDNVLATYSNKVDITKGSNSLVGIVGKGMEKTPGIIARMGSALAKKGINIYYQFDVSSLSCGVIVDRQQAEEAVELLYDEFKLSTF